MSPTITVSACLIVKDEERSLPGCLDSLRPIVDEIVVVDTGSSDGTVDAAIKGGANVFHHPWDDDFSAARNQALEQARGDWILVVDADERLQWEGYEAFRAPLGDPGKWGFLLTLVNLLEEGSSSVLLLRLFRNHPEVRFTGIVHERVDPSLVERGGDPSKSIGRHDAQLHHCGYLAARKREKGKDDRDMRLLKKQINADPGDPYHWYKLAAHPYARERMAEEVDEALARAWALLLEQDPKSTRYSYTPEVAALYLLALLSRRDLEESLSVARVADGFTCSSPNLDYAMGVCRLAAGDVDRASDHLEKALAHEDRVTAYAPIEGVTGHLSLNALSEVRYLQGRGRESYECFQKASLYSGHDLANTFHGSVKTITERGDAGWSLHLLTQASRLQPEDPSPWKRGAELFQVLGMGDKAALWLEKAATQITE